MEYSLKLRQKAIADIGEAFEWYEQQKQELGEEFLAALNDAFDFISSNPKAFPERYPKIRACSLKRFPYQVY